MRHVEMSKRRIHERSRQIAVLARARDADEARLLADVAIAIDLLEVANGRLAGIGFHALFEGGRGPRRADLSPDQREHQARRSLARQRRSAPAAC